MNNDNKPKVLVVDDEADIRELLEITLGRMGLATGAAADLTQAGARLAEQRFDLCLTDMRLPAGDGIELVRHIAAEHPDTPVAVITDFGNTEAAVDSLKAGA
ncbi:MAG: response regulator, partial [Salinisphaera sp.]|nr:response regulator [Salinisphaera sp.]